MKTRYLVLLFLLVQSAGLLLAQEGRLMGNREILVYKVDAKTSEGRLKGVLQRITPEQVYITTDSETKVIPSAAIKTLKVKFDKKKSVPVFRNMAQTALDIAVDPPYTTGINTAQDINGVSMALGSEEVSMGERLLVSGAVMTGAVLGNELAKLVPPATIETFKIGYSKEKYQSIYDNLAMYTVDLQSSLEYEHVLREKLKKAMADHKLKP